MSAPFRLCLIVVVLLFVLLMDFGTLANWSAVALALWLVIRTDTTPRDEP